MSRHAESGSGWPVAFRIGDLNGNDSGVTGDGFGPDESDPPGVENGSGVMANGVGMMASDRGVVGNGWAAGGNGPEHVERPCEFAPGGSTKRTNRSGKSCQASEARQGFP